MALENLSNIFEKESLEVSDIEKNIVNQQPVQTSVGLDSVYDDIIKLSPILYQEPNSPLSIDTSPIEFPLLQTGQNLSFESNPTENSSEKVKKRKDDLFVNLGADNKLGLNKLVLESLYKNNHRGSPDREPIDIGKVDENGNAILINTLQSGIGNLGNLDIKGYSNLFRNGIGFLKEPYIVHNIPKSGLGSALQGVGQNRDFIPWRAALDDVSRLAQFYTSAAGLTFIAKENITNALIGETPTIDEPASFVMIPPIPVPTTGFLNFYQQSLQKPGGINLRKPGKIEYSTRASVGLPFDRLGDLSIGLNQVLARTEIPSKLPLFIKKGLAKVRDKALSEIESVGQIPALVQKTPFMDLSGGPSKNHVGKYVDLVNKRGPTFSDDGDTEAFGNGDFYVKIKDLRKDGRFIYFRGFVTGITENANPSFSSVNYIGRSEPVYQYERGERDISFNLKVYPNNEREFRIMYEKINALTSLAYPHYLPDSNNASLTRMQAPFTELYMAHIGTPTKGQFGFIKSLSYTVEETGDWDALTALPRLFSIAISYQILNKRAPSLENSNGDTTQFYGSGREVKII